MLFICILQSDPDVLNRVLSEESNGNFSVIAFSIITYLVCALIQYILNLLLKKKDVSNDRNMKIADLSIKEEIDLYRKLDHLRIYQKGENQELLTELERIRELLNSNRLLYRKKVYKIAESYVDYFSSVCTDYTKRDAKLEIEKLEAFRDWFYGK